MKIFSQAVGKEWRKHFAWRPVRTENFEWVWFEWVEKKIFTPPLLTRPSSWIIYRRIKNDL